MKGLTQVVRGGLLAEAGPEEFHHPLSGKSALWRQGEHLDQNSRLSETPLLCPYGSGAHGNLKAAEQPHSHHLEPLSSRRRLLRAFYTS
jgi:hypothetical protein